MSATWLRVQLWVVTGILCALGVTMITSITATNLLSAEINTGAATKQILSMIVGLCAAAAVSWLGLRRLQHI